VSEIDDLDLAHVPASRLLSVLEEEREDDGTHMFMSNKRPVPQLSLTP
jgi:hypothetical protein